MSEANTQGKEKINWNFEVNLSKVAHNTKELKKVKNAENRLNLQIIVLCTFSFKTKSANTEIKGIQIKNNNINFK